MPSYPDPATVAADHAAFLVLMAEHHQAVAAIVAHARPDDPEAVTADIWARLWRVYPQMRRAEVAALAAGRPAPHRWGPFIARLAKRITVDHYRRQVSLARALGVRALRRLSGAPSPALAGAARGPDRTWDARLVDPDDLPAPAGATDPALLAERAEQLAILRSVIGHLAPDERLILALWSQGHSDRHISAALAQDGRELPPRAVKAARHRALARLRALFHARSLTRLQPN